MTKVSINLLGWNHKEIVGKAIESVLAQTYRDFELIYTDNASRDGSVAYVKENFPKIRIVENKENLGYAGGHNQFFRQTQSEFLMVMNPDACLEKNFLAEAIQAFSNPDVASVTGKMLKPDSNILDGTGIILSRTRRAKERGQHEVDRGQFDDKADIFGVSGTAAIYRKSALEKVRVPRDEENIFEYFDEDFFAYFEDMDLAWRLNLGGFKARFVPKAIVYHARKAGSSPGGFMKFFSFFSHRKTLDQKIRKWSFKNHLFAIIKNDSGLNLWADLPFILVREIAMFFFILIFETSTLSVVPEIIIQLPIILKKRSYILNNIKVK
ncbi:MAG: hypothetical protein A2826_01680 [Candidatus Doudnabacteria bacterium RIFCSPHIGHO2_01_FULL_43_23]|uniref:Glycosyltransferase 2-like domain-containing protein n=1 Tax=Candidatus Doudnabacteria bacterium RIFCSPHIGHO2_01_FULL_43_23 TaxID=1817822 RepID=A0A1F5NS71_9BACT|nr:MAG: hypothetical protein A2826_01680 [Candidatus Doudnabacteria bacterium RIFCSPHIGHO2_01_FULL_43_23]